MAAIAQSVIFPPFSLDFANEQLWRGDTPIVLRRQTFAVLRYLIERAGQIVTKQALLEALWPGIYVTDVAPMICINELRKTLGDSVKHPRFIETVHRRGYRFIASVTTTPRQGLESRVQHLASKDKSSRYDTVPTLDPRRQTLETPLVGRETELAQLHRWLDKALRGERQVVFVTGEAGIGKTTLVEAFVSRVRSHVAFGVQKATPRTLTPELPTPSPWLGRGQSVEHYGASEPYLPVLEALGRLGRGLDGEHLIAVLRQYAPTWLVHLPALVSPAEREQLQREVQGATPQRMLRELAEALEALTAEHPLLLVLEDLHWSDVSTLDFLSVVARRTERARLFIIGSYRPAEVLGNGHPLRTVMQELHLHKQCEELRLGLLSEEDVAAYLRKRLSVGAHGRAPFQRLATLLHRRTDGNPLFLVSVVEDLVTQGALVQDNENWTLQEEGATIERSVPENIRQLVARQGERLARAAQRVLEAGSVAGMEFSAAAVVAALAWDVADIEEQCAALAERQQFLRPAGIAEWPDGTRAARYGFLHALYQQLWHERVGVSQLQRWQVRIGERKEAAYGERTREIATELAVHFERGRDHRKAVQYLHQAGENANRRSAHVEAINLLTKGLELLKPLPDTPERLQQELALQIALGVSLALTRGYAAPEVEKTYTRALALCRQVGETPQLFRVLRGLWVFYEVRAEYQTARELAEQCLTLAQRAQDLPLLLEARLALGQTLYYLGELAPAREHWEQGIALYTPQKHHTHAFRSPAVLCLQFTAFALWHLGYPEQALKRIHEALSLAQELADPFNSAFTIASAAQLHQYRREGRAAQERAEAAVTLATEQEFALPLTIGTMIQGWALAVQGHEEEGIAQLQEGLAAYQATGVKTLLPYFLALLAEAYGRGGQTDKGLSVLAEALAMVEKTGERWHEAELYRLKGQLTLQSRASLGQTQGKSQASLGHIKTSQTQSEVPSTQHPAPKPKPKRAS